MDILRVSFSALHEGESIRLAFHKEFGSSEDLEIWAVLSDPFPNAEALRLKLRSIGLPEEIAQCGIHPHNLCSITERQLTELGFRNPWQARNLNQPIDCATLI